MTEDGNTGMFIDPSVRHHHRMLIEVTPDSHQEIFLEHDHPYEGHHTHGVEFGASWKNVKEILQ
jgi:hypothetical protein